MRRREFITLLGSAAAAWPQATRAQEAGRIYRLGIMTGAARAATRMVAFFDELKLFGFVEGQNLKIVVGGFDLRDDQFAEVAATLVNAAADAIFCVSDAATRDVQESVHTVPIVGLGATALNVLTAPLFSFNRRIVIERAAALGMPAIYEWPEMAEEGGLLGYGPRLMQIYRQLARLLVKVLRGVKPEDLPAEQPTNFDLVVNVATANALGLAIPESFLVRADKVIE
jgi:ABC-type uncharacterized transport system substrate-binding protein